MQYDGTLEKELDSGGPDYIMTGQHVWITVGSKTVEIQQDPIDWTVRCSIFKLGEEDRDTLAQCEA